MIAHRSGDIVVTSSISGHQAIHWEPICQHEKKRVNHIVVAQAAMGGDPAVDLVRIGHSPSPCGDTQPRDFAAEPGPLKGRPFAENAATMIDNPRRPLLFANLC
jgi:hypothetical protein